MKAKACIIIGDDVDSLFAALKPELKDISDRASFSMAKRKGCLEINITAQDYVALRASLNSIAKLLIVYEKTKLIVDWHPRDDKQHQKHHSNKIH